MLPNETLDAVTAGRKGFEYGKDGDLQGVSGEQGINLLRLHYLYSSMKLELKTGMKISGKVNTLKVANQMLGTNYKRKQQAFDHLEAVLQMAGELKGADKGDDNEW